MEPEPLFEPAHPLPPEIRALLGVMATHFGRPFPDIGSDIRWPLFVSAIRYHRVAPLIGAVLKADLELPPAVREEIALLRRQAALGAFRLNAELLSLVKAFRDAGLECLVLKGPALSALLYGDPCRRWSRDIDLLVHPEDEPRALALLRSLGYGCEPEARVQGPNAISLSSRRAHFTVELHSRLGDDDRLLPQAVLRPFETATEVAVGGVSVPTLGLEPAVIYAAHHGAGHLWQHLYWLGDIAAASHSGRVDWPRVLELSRALGTDRHLALAMRLVQDLIGLPLPAPLAADLKGQALARRAARPLQPIMATLTFPSRKRLSRDFGFLNHLWWDMKLAHRWSARYALLAARFQPTPLDRRSTPLPSGLGFLYLPLRLIRILSERWRQRRNGNVD